MKKFRFPARDLRGAPNRLSAPVIPSRCQETDVTA